MTQHVISREMRGEILSGMHSARTVSVFRLGDGRFELILEYRSHVDPTEWPSLRPRDDRVEKRRFRAGSVGEVIDMATAEETDRPTRELLRRTLYDYEDSQ